MRSGKVSIGVLGLGPAGRAMLPYIEAHPAFRLKAVCDARPEVLEGFEGAEVAVYSDLEQMAADDEIEAVFVATPTWLHEGHSVALLRSGKHVLVEKPMAVTLAEADAMMAAARSARRALIVGHSQSFEPAIQVMRAVVESGRLGALRAVNGLNYSDWMYRPREPREFDRSLGGGVVYRQAAHHMDIVRYLIGEAPTSLRAVVGDWRDDRPGDGSYSALLQFANGAAATLFYSGYGHFSSQELTFGVNESGARDAQAATPDRRAELLRPGSFPSTFGLVVVSCEGGDMRTCPDGVCIYSGHQPFVVPLDGLPVGRQAVLDELLDAIMGRRTTHGGVWGRANLELCLAMLRSSEKRSQVEFGSAADFGQVIVPDIITSYLERLVP